MVEDRWSPSEGTYDLILSIGAGTGLLTRRRAVATETESKPADATSTVPDGPLSAPRMAIPAVWNRSITLPALVRRRP